MSRLLQTKEIAHRLGVHDQTVRRLYRDGKLPGATKRGGRTSPITMTPEAFDRLFGNEEG
jgi:excisionase family DNA binding protein